MAQLVARHSIDSAIKDNVFNHGGMMLAGPVSPAGVKKRQRLRRESREQLLERLRNPQLSLHEAAILLRVCRATVRRYADSGQLPHVRTPGGQRRFYLRDIESFYKQIKK